MFKTILDILCLYLVKGIFTILKILPERCSEKFACALVKSFLLFMPRHRYVAFRNMDIVIPGRSLEEKRKILEANYLIMAKNLVGLIRGSTYTKETVLNSFDVSEALPVISKIGKEQETGTFMLVPHFGSFEKFALYWSIYDRPVSIIARGFGLPRTDAYWHSLREIHGNRISSRKGGFNTIVSDLNKGENVTILFDQNVKPNHAAYVPFFGVLAATTKSIALASIRTDCPIVMAAMVETSPSHYKLYAYSIKKPNDREGTQEEKIYETIKEAHQYLEQIILKHPEQWFWIHRRFKTRPKGEAENLYDPEIYPIEAP